MIRRTALFSVIAIALIAWPRYASAEAQPSPSPSPPHRIEIRAGLATVLLTQAVSGPGLTPSEAAGFANGAPNAPASPYDLFSGAPMVPGNVAQNQLTVDVGWHGSRSAIGLQFGAESLFGDRTNEAYWAEPLQPQDNPHVGSPATGYAIAFPTHPGTDDYSGVRASVLALRAAFDNDRGALRWGWFDLQQTLGFVFAPPPTTNALPALGLKTPESLYANLPSLEAWSAPPATLPLRGIDIAWRIGPQTLEAANAQLPSLPGTIARISSFSFGHFDDRGHGAMLQAMHAQSGGDPISTTTGFGVPLHNVLTNQGLFAISTLYGQRQTIVGTRVGLALGGGFDGTLDYAHSDYQADGVRKPQTARGNWEHGSVAHALGAGTFAAHFYRFEPTFATMILPYGVPENVWSVAYSWPGPWLKSNYQLVDNTVLGVNRDGPLLAYGYDGKRSRAYVSYGTFRQIKAFTVNDERELGFVEGFFLVQPDWANPLLGVYHRTALYAAKDLSLGTIGMDFVDDDLHRDARRSGIDAVSYDAPQTVLMWSKPIADRAVAAAGTAYYGMRGTWADGAFSNVDIGMHAWFAGAQIAQRDGAFMIAVRQTRMRGKPYTGFPPFTLPSTPPNFDATTLVLERRFRL